MTMQKMSLFPLLWMVSAAGLLGQHSLSRVTTLPGDDAIDHKWPSINNSGDMVWSQKDGGGNWQIFKQGPSTGNDRVQMTTDARNHERPVISDNGTIVWFQDNSGAGVGWQVVGCGPNCPPNGSTYVIEFSSRNSLTGDHRDAGRTFGIASNGTTISYYDFYGFSAVRRFNVSGVGQLAGSFLGYDHPDINSNNIIVYVSPAGQVTMATAGVPAPGVALGSGSAPRINDILEIVYITGGGVVTRTGAGAPTAVAPGLWADINNRSAIILEQRVNGVSQVFLAQKSAIQITLSQITPNNQYLIDAAPTMPIIRAAAKVINVTPDPTPTTTFTWKAQLRTTMKDGNLTTCQDGPEVSYDQDIVQDVRTTGSAEYTLTFQDPTVFRGGKLTLVVTAVIDGQAVTAKTPDDLYNPSSQVLPPLVIDGTNPRRTTIQDAIDTGVPLRSFYGLQNGDIQDVLKRIACQESNQRQFSALANGGPGPVFVSCDNGIGIFQITRNTSTGVSILFAAQPSILFDWRSNTTSGIVTYQDKAKVAKGYPAALQNRPQYQNFIANTINPQRIAAGLSPIPIVPAPPFTTSGSIGSTTPNQLLEDAVRGYNGFAGPPVYGLNVLHEFIPDTDFLLTVPDSQLPTLSTNPNVWKRVCLTNCVAVRGGSGDPDYVRNVISRTASCGG